MLYPRFPVVVTCQHGAVSCLSDLPSAVSDGSLSSRQIARTGYLGFLERNESSMLTLLHSRHNFHLPRAIQNALTRCIVYLLATVRLLGQDAAVITSGIGPVAAGLCVQELLQCASVVKDMIYVGTSGWSPQRGGVLRYGYQTSHILGNQHCNPC